MDNKKLYYDLLEEVYKSLNRYNQKPNHHNEDDLFYQVAGFNRFARKHKLKEIPWTRDNNSFTYQSFGVFYVPFNTPKEK